MAETLHAKLHEGEKENNQRRKMSGIDLIFMAVFCLVLGYAIRDGIQISRDFNEAMRNLEAAHLAHEKAMRHAAAHEMVEEWETAGSPDFWSEFCPKCRSVHGAGGCATKI